MDMNHLTQKSIAAVKRAQAIAISYQHMQVDQEHLALALMEEKGALISQLLSRMGVQTELLCKDVTEALGRMPRVTGSGRDADKVYISQELDKALIAAEQQAKQMKDEYLSVEHMWLGMMDKPNRTLQQLLRQHNISRDAFLKELAAVRGATRVTTDSPEDTYDALKKYGSDLVELARMRQSAM